MAKTKSDNGARAGKSSKAAEVKAISSVKEGAVTKPSQTPKAKSQEMAKQVAVKADKVNKESKKGKVVKEPTPESSSDESVDEAASSDSSESDGSDEDVPKSAVVTNGKTNGKVNGTAKVAAKPASESSDSSSSSDAEQASKDGPVAEASDDSDDDEEDEDDDSDESDGDDEPKAKGPVDAKALSGALEKVASEDVSDEDSADSDDSGSEESSAPDADSADSDSSSLDESEDEAPPKKRKAEAQPAPVAKKAKKEETSNGGGEGVKNLFVGSLSWGVDEAVLSAEFETFGELSGVRIITDKNTGRSKGFGYVEFVNAADAAKAHEQMKGKMVDGRAINVDFAAPRKDEGGAGNRANDRAKSFGDQASEPSDTLFVGNIAFDANEDIIGQEFGKHGTIQGVRLPTDQESGQPKGFGYVQFGSTAEAQAAFEALQGVAICGRPVRLDFARARASNGDSPRGGRGGGGFGGGRGRGSDRGGRGGGRGRGGFGDRGGRGGGFRGGRGGSTNRGGFGDFQGKKMTF